MFQFDADLTSTETGAWAEFQGSQFLIAHISNMRFQRTLARLQQPYRRKIENGSMDPQTSKDILCRAMSEAILLDWKDVANTDGEATKYTPAAGNTALSKNAEFRDFVSDFAVNLSNFRDQEAEDLGKP